MLRQRTRTLQAAVAVADAASTIAAFFVAYYAAGPLLERLPGMKVVLPVTRYLWVLGMSVPMWWVLFAAFRCYDFSPLARLGEGLGRMWRPLLVGTLAVGTATFFYKEPHFSRRVVAAFLFCNVLFILLGRTIALAAAAKSHKAAGGMRKVLFVGSGKAGGDFAETIRRSGWGLAVAGFIATEATPNASDSACLGTLDDLPQILDERSIDDVVISDPGGDLATVQHIINVCEEVGVCIHIPSRFFSASISRPHVETFRGIPMLTFSTAPYNPVALGVKRAADILFGLLLLLLFAVPMAIFAIIIKLTSPGRVIFKQRRCGLYGREFTMYKFRSMRADAEQRKAELTAANEMDGPAFKMRDDPRVTPFGRFLRRHSLDELPQLWNVLKGDMGLIGPRPPLPGELEQYERWQRRRLCMRPGLTCIWQVTDRNLATFEKWMEYDLHYIDNWSLWLDLKIALRTIPAMLRGTGM